MHTKKGYRYDEDFKRDAVELMRSSGKTMTQISRELGVSCFSLRGWEKKLKGISTLPPVGGAAPLDPHIEIKRLRHQLDYVTRQRDILKKAVAICSEIENAHLR